METLQNLQTWLGVGLTLWTAGLTLVVWLRKPGADASVAVAALEADQRVRHHALNDRVTTLEERVRHMPTSDELSDLEGTVKAINERTEGLAEAVTTIRASLARIESFLLHSKK